MKSTGTTPYRHAGRRPPTRERGRARIMPVPGRRRRLVAGPWLWFILLHAPLVAAMKLSPPVATAHALLTAAVGLRCLRFRTCEYIIYVIGYVAASEPLWRVSRALIFYESGKYLVAALSILAILRFRLLTRCDKLPLFYFLLLLPSVLMLPEFDRRQVSFNLSGPFALAMCSLFLSTQRISVEMLRKLFLVIQAPILGFAFVATFSTVTTENINFYGSKVASGGLGNNQASSILGLGLLIAFLYVFIDRHNRPLRWFMAAVGIWCGAQALLTFSRGGVATAIGAIAATSVFLLRDRRSRGALMLRIGLLVLLAVYVVIPQLNVITSGAFADRFTSSHLTGRDRIMEADLMAFRENPLFGVGPGQSKAYHVRTFRLSSSHTEYTRLLAEHGLHGLASMLMLLWMAGSRLMRRAPPASKALAAGFTTWSLLFMFHAAMRMAVVSFIFALGAAYLLAEAPTTPALGRRRRQALVPPPSARRAGSNVPPRGGTPVTESARPATPAAGELCRSRSRRW